MDFQSFERTTGQIFWEQRAPHRLNSYRDALRGNRPDAARMPVHCDIATLPTTYGFEACTMTRLTLHHASIGNDRHDARRATLEICSSDRVTLDFAARLGLILVDKLPNMQFRISNERISSPDKLESGIKSVLVHIDREPHAIAQC
jgi:hypothetical protein